MGKLTGLVDFYCVAMLLILKCFVIIKKNSPKTNLQYLNSTDLATMDSVTKGMHIQGTLWLSTLDVYPPPAAPPPPPRRPI